MAPGGAGPPRRLTPALRVILASAFAAPLVALSGRPGGRLLSIAGAHSGVGKTTAMDLAQSVWGHMLGTLRMNATTNAVPEFVAQLRSLPVYWDEVRGVDPEQYMNTMFSIVEGRGRLRLNSNVELRETAHWNNMVVVASNFSTRDRAAMAETVPGEGPQKARVFECTVPDHVGVVVSNLHLQGQAAAANRGTAGEAYVRFLMPQWRAVQAKIIQLETMLTQILDAPGSSRFHISSMALLLAGAWLATQAGIVRFDIPSLREYLLQQYRHMMADSNGPVVLVNGEAADAQAVRHMEEFLSAHQGTTLVTYTTSLSKGRHPNVQPIRVPTKQGEPVVVHIVLNDGLILIDTLAWEKWLVRTGRVRQSAKHLMQSVFGMDQKQRALGAGTPFSRVKVWTMVIPLKHPDLVELAQSYGANIAGFQLPADTAVPVVVPPVVGASPYLH